jgi:hypothetical protein
MNFELQCNFILVQSVLSKESFNNDDQQYFHQNQQNNLSPKVIEQKKTITYANGNLGPIKSNPSQNGAA